MRSRDARDSCGRTALYYAAHECNIEVVETLVGYGADPHAQDSHESTTLHVIAGGRSSGQSENREESRMELATYFLNLGVDVDALNKYNGTPLVAAAENGFEEQVKLFLDGAANVHHRSSTNGTAIEASIVACHEKIAHMLIWASYQQKQRLRNLRCD